MGKYWRELMTSYRIPVPKKNEEQDYYKQILNAVKDVQVI